MEGAQGKAKRRVAGQFARDGCSTGTAAISNSTYLHIVITLLPISLLYLAFPYESLVGGGREWGEDPIVFWCYYGMVWFGVVGHMKGVNSNLRGGWHSEFLHQQYERERRGFPISKGRIGTKNKTKTKKSLRPGRIHLLLTKGL
ncbi:hypothetical protein NL676_037290 [Syzygium grande]|nr:hypothetical protein NL676_037290 [Syzygium grande]